MTSKKTVFMIFLIPVLILFIVFLSDIKVRAQDSKQKVEQIEKRIIITTRYLVYLPDGYNNDTVKKWPLLIFLHGSGERGDDIEKVRNSALPRLIEEGKKFPFIVVSPQCPERSNWQTDILMDVLKKIKEDYRIDEDRIYLTGLSMGGYGTWYWAGEYPELFAAAAPICGGWEPDLAYRLKYLSVWAFHGDKDNVVPLEETLKMTEALKNCGGDVRLTIYPGVGHNSWDNAYADENLYTWFLSQKRKKIEIEEIKKYKSLSCGPAPADIKVDGLLSEWKKVPVLELASDDLSQLMRRVKLTRLYGQQGKSIYSGPEDCRALIKMMWDQKGLYLAAEVTDDKMICDRQGDPIWIGDSIDLGLSFRDPGDIVKPYILPCDPNKSGWENFTEKDFIIGFAPSGPDQNPQYHVYRNPVKQNLKAAPEDIRVASQLTEKGYIIEAFISAEFLGIKGELKKNRSILFNCGIYDLDEKAEAQDFDLSEWPSSGGDPWSPDTFGRLILK